METFERDGCRFDVHDAGPESGEPVLLLHGFPQDSRCWSRLAPLLHEAGYRTIALDQRGYSPEARPAGRRSYRLAAAGADVAALADAAGWARFHLVGHDWGGAVGWGVGTAMPERLASLTVVSTPHPEALRSALLHGQLLRSWYMLAFQLPWLPERLLLARGGRRLTAILQRAGIDGTAAEYYAARMAEPGAMTAALNWYRALPWNAARMPSVPAQVRVLYAWSDRDVALGRLAAERTARYVRGPYRFVELPGVSHWIPEEAPEQLAAALLPHLAGAEPGR